MQPDTHAGIQHQHMIETMKVWVKHWLGRVSVPFSTHDAGGIHARLVRPVVNRLLARWTPGTAALVRTTVAPTLASAGVQDNVLPESGKVAFNFRTLPGTPKRIRSPDHIRIHKLWVTAAYTCLQAVGSLAAAAAKLQRMISRRI